MSNRRRVVICVLLLIAVIALFEYLAPRDGCDVAKNDAGVECH